MTERILLSDVTRAQAVARAGAVLREGGIAILPAEGLYGYHVLAVSAPGLARLESLKPRGPGKGWIGLVARPADAYRWIAALPASAVALIQRHWPGPLTVVCAAGPGVPPALVGPEGSVALRCPGSDFLRDVILGAGGLVISTSANAPGASPAPSAPSPEEAPEGVALVVDSGLLSGMPSTVVRATTERLTVLRAGAVAVPEAPLDAPTGGP